MAGDVVLPQRIDGDGVYSCGTITLGGVETRDGTKGLIVSAHVVAARYDYHDTKQRNRSYANYSKTDILLGHGEYMKTVDIGRLLGKVYRTPTIADDGDKKLRVLTPPSSRTRDREHRGVR